jgi:CRP/FNR family cyclic AMP-dependent transcriptional regulator
VLFLPADIILREGEQGDNIYLLNKGEVEVLIKSHKKENDVVATLNDGSIFGEIALLTKLKRTATVKASNYSSCAYLARNEIKTLENHFPHIV